MGLEKFNISETLVVKTIPEVLKPSTFYLLKTNEGAFSFYATDQNSILRKLECCKISDEDYIGLMLNNKTDILNILNSTSDHGFVSVEYNGEEPFLYRENNNVKQTLKDSRGNIGIYFKKGNTLTLSDQDFNENYLVWFNVNGYRDGGKEKKHYYLGPDYGGDVDINISENINNYSYFVQKIRTPLVKDELIDITVDNTKAINTYGHKLSLVDYPNYNIELNTYELSTFKVIPYSGNYKFEFKGLNENQKVKLSTNNRGVIFDGIPNLNQETNAYEITFSNYDTEFNFEVLQKVATFKLLGILGENIPLVYYRNGERVQSENGDIYLSDNDTFEMRISDYNRAYHFHNIETGEHFGANQWGGPIKLEKTFVSYQPFMSNGVKEYVFQATDITRDVIVDNTKTINLNSDTDNIIYYVIGSTGEGTVPEALSVGNNNINIREGETLFLNASSVEEGKAYQVTPIGGRITNVSEQVEITYEDLNDLGDSLNLSVITINTKTKRLIINVPGQTFKYSIIGMDSSGLFTDDKEATNSVTLDLEESYMVTTKIGNVTSAPSYNEYEAMNNSTRYVMNAMPIVIKYSDLTEDVTTLNFNEIVPL